MQHAAYPLDLGHSQAIILSKNVMKNKMKDTIEYIRQTPLLRYNILLFGTEDNIQNLLTLWKHYIQLFFIVFNVFKGMGKWTWVTGERNNLEV
ncbi:hypothetical protein J2S10_004253 [Neobacillus ginsengisoli]|uniref:Spore germination protein N-terminal domain-containing protein n=1 Tax=Neobacillus ginsengisoli TaxID=904295 RepID=A0ABT9XZQ0_9BACI|nr:hypothetical protein [Neobacillus ginsengisoli]MDQ0201047.1 hypothetical protein [Neobacillus ginsengisoli]